MYARNRAKGSASEDLFGQLLSKYGQVNKATSDQDMYEHWDYSLVPTGSNVTYTYDVKCPTNYPGFVWLELANVNGQAGSLHGKADYMAFHLPDKFLIQKREVCLTYALHYRQGDVMAMNGNPKPYHVYSRKGKRDQILFMPVQLLAFEAKYLYIP